MAEDQRREPDNKKHLLYDQEKRVSIESRPETHAGSHKGAQEEEAMARQGDGVERVRLQISTRRVRIDPAKKRENYIARLEKVVGQCDKMISDPEGVEEIQVKAMSVLIRAIKVCYGLVVDVEVEHLEQEVEELEEEERELAEKRGEDALGYEIAEDPPE